MFQMLGVLSEFERAIIVERVNFRRFGLGMELFHAHLSLIANSLWEGEP